MGLGIKVDLHDFRRLVRELDKVSKVALPFAVRRTLNDLAFEGRKEWQREMRSAFVLRNDWTTRRLLVEKVKGGTVASMRSTLLSPDAYLIKQEIGGTENHSVPTGVATAEGRGANPRRKLVRQPNKVSAIALGQSRPRGNRRQRNAIAVHVAQKKGLKFVYLEGTKRKGLFRIKGGKRNPTLDMVWDTTKKSHRVQPTPTLARAVRKVEAKMPALMTSALIEQLKRHKVWGY